ncbi:uncharacterized protein LOC133885385 [Phragmites australis]|uniref:uncharacterized protein LOC133885385 n=1 Tax=Phragmites australis TaxID=29695 RepID=UPI002D772A54|nr:uncharacterized protein LOC133885385 [Phragmites australis]XP_062181082.1 uncharacterized protein LOC133885385 [Phragmites australis]
MASEPKEMKYRRRARVPEPADYEQCSDRSGALDWGALKQDPVELLRKLDEIRDQITRSCELMGQPPERNRVNRRAVSLRPSHAEPPHRVNRRAVSLRPSHAEPPPPTGRGPEYYRSRYTGSRYGTSLPPSPYDKLQRSVCDERYAREPSGRFRQYPEWQWENSGFVQGTRHLSTCQCRQCLQGQRAVAPEEHIPMARYFAGQQGSFRFDRSHSISSEYDRRSLASSLYSHLSMSKRRVEYFRKKAESFCRPMKGASPFVVCSSCCQLLQLPPGKCTTRKKNEVQCGSCSEIITFKPKEVKVHPLIPPSSFPVSKSVRSSSRRDPKSFQWYQHQDDDNFNFYKLQAHDSHRQKKDFSDSISPSSTASYGRTDSERGSNRSIQLNSVSVGRSRFSDNPKDILCQGDTDSPVEASAQCTVSPHGPILEDKKIDPSSSQRKNYSGGDQIRSKEFGINSKAGYESNARDERIGMKCIHKSKEGRKDGLGDECSNQTYDQNSREGNVDNPGNGIVGNKYKQKINSDVTSSLEHEGVSTRYEHNSSFRVQGANKGYDVYNKKDNNNNTLGVGSVTKRCEQENMKDDCVKLLHSNSKNANTLARNGSSVNERTNSSSRFSSEAEVGEIQSSTGKNGDSSFLSGFLKKGFKDLSLFSQSVDNTKVSINGHPISERALRKAEKKAGPVGPGSYWYDYRAGFWGVFGRECSGIIPSFIKEFNYPMPKDCAGGNTGVFVNGRELHQKDFDLLVGRGLPRISGKSYSVEISGNVIDDTTGKKLRGLGKLAPTIEKMKRGFGMHTPEETS